MDGQTFVVIVVRWRVLLLFIFETHPYVVAHFEFFNYSRAKWGTPIEIIEFFVVLWYQHVSMNYAKRSKQSGFSSQSHTMGISYTTPPTPHRISVRRREEGRKKEGGINKWLKWGYKVCRKNFHRGFLLSSHLDVACTTLTISLTDVFAFDRSICVWFVWFGTLWECDEYQHNK